MELDVPLSQSRIRKLKVGDKVRISGTVFTARDKAHLYLLRSDELSKKLCGGLIYHCGPIIRRGLFGRKVISAGPTTSERLSIYAPKIIERYNLRGFIGKGGMDQNTLMAMKKFGCAYFAAIGGAGALIASSIRKVVGVYKAEFGMPEAIYELQVENMPLVVAMDALGNSIYDRVMRDSKKVRDELIKQ